MTRPDTLSRFVSAVELACGLQHPTEIYRAILSGQNLGNSVDRMRETVFTKDMTTTTSHKELTAHLRDRIKVAGIKGVGVRMLSYCGEQVVSVYPKGGVDARISDADQDTIAQIAEVNGLTFSQGLPVAAAVDGFHVHGTGFRFYMGYAR